MSSSHPHVRFPVLSSWRQRPHLRLAAGGHSDSPSSRDFRLACTSGERGRDLAEPAAHMGSDSSGTHYKSWVPSQQAWLLPAVFLRL